MPDGLPRLGQNTLETRAARSGRIWEARQRARDQVTEEFETIDDPDEVPIRRREGGFGPGAAFLERAEPREAASRLDSEFPRQDLGPADVERGPEGQFRPTEGTRRRSAAYEFEDTTPLDDVDPFGGLVAQDGGFGLAEGPQRRLAAQELDPQLPALDVEPTDVQRTDEGAFGLTPGAERELAAERLEDQTPLGEVAPSDVQRTDSGFELRDSVLEANRGLFR